MRVYLLAIFALLPMACGGSDDPAPGFDAGVDARNEIETFPDSIPGVGASDAKDAPVPLDSGLPDRPVASLVDAGAGDVLVNDAGQDGDAIDLGSATEIYLFPSVGIFNTCVGRESPEVEFTTLMPGPESFRPYLAVIRGSDSSAWTIRSNTCGSESSAGRWCSIIVVFRPSVPRTATTATLTVSDSAGLFVPDSVMLTGTAEVCD